MFENLSAEITELKERYMVKTQSVFEARKEKNGENPLYREIEQDRIHTNFLRIIPASLMLIIIEGCGMVWATLAKVKFDSGNRFVCSFIVFCVIAFYFLYVVNSSLKKVTVSNSRKRVIYVSYWLIHTIEAMTFFIMEGFDRGTVNNYITFLIVFTVLPIIEPVGKGVFYLMALVTEVVTIILADARPGSLVACLMATAIAYAVSFIRFYYYISDKITTKKLEFSANGDALTGFINRRGFETRFPALEGFCKGNNYSLCMIMIDVDDFKKCNDIYGHLKGDRCLRTVAHCIGRHFSRPTDLCVRYGGEEFIVATAQKGAESLIVHLTEMLYDIETLDIEDIDHKITVSIGVCISDGPPTEDMVFYIDKADTQLYNAKNNGKNCVSYEDKIYRSRPRDEK